MNQPSEQGNGAGRLAKHVGLVTGGGSGIGRAAALAYGREGATALVARRRAAEIGETATMVTEAGGLASCCSADISRDGDLMQLMSFLHERCG